jgi:phosphatidylglycerol:prolipoprotein diacylglycerol transferase
VIDPIALRIGSLEIHWYGIIIATAVLLAALLGSAEARRRGEDPERGWSMLLGVLVAGIVGARLYHVIHEWDFYSENLALVPQVWKGGIGIPGAVAGGALAVIVYARAQGLNTARWLDIFAPALLLGQAIGRLGNFVNQELYGPPTDLPWGIPIDVGNRVGPWTDLAQYPVATTRFHPLFAYEGLLNLAGMLLLLWIGRRFAHRLYDGDLALLYFVWYGAVRTALETLRVDNWTVLGVPTAMWLGVAAIVLAGGFFVLRHARGWGTPGPWLRRDEEPDAAGGARAGAAEPQPG